MATSSVYVFDAYGTLFDVHSAAARAKDEIGPAWERLSEIWRTKQLEYTWVHAAAGRHATFAELSGQSLDYAIARVGGVPAGVRARLLAAYRELDAFPDVEPVLRALTARGARLAILSNGDPDMLDGAVRAAGLEGHFAAVISVAEVGVYKPSMKVYAHCCQRLETAPAAVSFQSSNRWDIAGAKAFGLATVWINRAGLPDEYPAMPADVVARDLSVLLD
jgi:2-haloacid dehalogenase